MSWVAAGAGLAPKLGVRGSWRRGGGWSWGVSPRLPSAISTVAAAGVIEMFRISIGGLVTRVYATVKTYQAASLMSVHLFYVNIPRKQKMGFWEEDASRGSARSVAQGEVFEF